MFGLLIAITKPKIIHCFNNERASPWEDVCGALSYMVIDYATEISDPMTTGL